MKRLLTERNLVIVLFVVVLVTFSFAQNETKRMEQQFGIQSSLSTPPALKLEASVNPPFTGAISSSNSN
jgi:sensor domain CHASE-containing protein